MRALHGLTSVRAKLLAIVAIISGIITIGIAVVVGLHTFTQERERRAELVRSQARVVAMNSSAPMAFGDRGMADDALGALRVVEGIEQATLRGLHGEVIASIDGPGRRDSAGPAAGADVPWPEGLHELPGGYALVLPVADEAGDHGWLQVVWRDTGGWTLATRIALQSLGLFAAAMALAWLLARRLHPVLTAPVLELERAARRVRETGDYGVRATRTSDDELGRLTDDFNAMLVAIGASQQALQQAQRRAEEASRLKDEFVATVSHELRTPLSPIVAWLQLLRMPTGAAQLPQALDVMERNARALTLIINDLLDMSRIVSGTMRLDMRDVDIDATIRAAVETVAPAAEGRQITLGFDLVSPSPRVRGDATRLQQVIWNLLSNAVKFTDPGGRIDVRTRIAEGQLRIEVVDSGIGIAPAFLPFVFDRFRQEDGSITRTHSGLGLGLSIARNLMELHGGSATAHSDGLGHGSRFVLTLPLATLPAAPAGEEFAPRADTGAELAGLTVLVIEDEPDMRRLVEHILGAAGAMVTGVGDAPSALAAFADQTPDVIVSDIGLPGMDGYALLGRLRELAPAGVPAVALTAYAGPEERGRAFAAGYDAHLAKPVEPQALVDSVRGVLRGSPG